VQAQLHSGNHGIRTCQDGTKGDSPRTVGTCTEVS
jgi:hypothetical protein